MTRSEKSREGYLLVDHSFSPGLPADVARASGYDPALCGEGKRFEAATQTCSHCGGSQVKNPLRTRERGHCSKCNHFLCDPCAAVLKLTGECKPYVAYTDRVCGSDKALPPLSLLLGANLHG